MFDRMIYLLLVFVRVQKSSGGTKIHFAGNKKKIKKNKTPVQPQKCSIFLSQSQQTKKARNWEYKVQVTFVESRLYCTIKGL